MATGSDAQNPRAEVPPIKFAHARGGRIAYQDFGSGPTVVAVPPMAQNVETAWEWPALRRMFEDFGSFSRWVQFDKRCTGASDRRAEVPGLDERVEDLRAVMDDAGIEHAFLYGASEGGPMCVLFAATYPERVDGLILHGTASSWRNTDLTEEQRAEAVKRRLSLADNWGTPDSPIAQLFAPSLADDEQFQTWMQRYERSSADRGSLLQLLTMMADFDVSELLADVVHPTLVMHRSGDQVIPVSYGQQLAEAIPGAEWIEHEGSDHFGFAGDQSWLRDLERFVTGTVRERPAPAPAHTVLIRTLGLFSVEVDGVEVPVADWKSRLPREICKRLVAARGWPITRDQLFDALWPDEHDRAKLGARLSVHLSGVRRVLGGGVIADRQTIALNLQEVTTDLEAFFEASTDEEVVQAYAGPFLPEDAYEDWTHAVRDEAQLRFTQAARRLVDDAMASHRYDDASELARRLVEVDRYDEAAHRALVTALVRAKELTLAQRAHDVWTKALAELDITVPPFATSEFV